jgi:hypothetical protein
MLDIGRAILKSYNTNLEMLLSLVGYRYELVVVQWVPSLLVEERDIDIFDCTNATDYTKVIYYTNIIYINLYNYKSQSQIQTFCRVLPRVQATVECCCESNVVPSLGCCRVLLQSRLL